ncbi:MAG: dihydropteroate synthase [Bacteroidetes bacterium HGW-Bacteroidetes-16]|nr:MAG: dihydropteroate synthase [Bacteroidetes bacterium HGW-Bacteroidetes-16]
MNLSYNGRTLDLSTPKVMGILNLTPDSFFDGGKHQHQDNILESCAQMLQDGARIIDIGGVSTRPGAPEVSEEEELKRVLPILQMLVKNFPETWFSLDTFRTAVVRICLDHGASIINDISGGDLDGDMFKTVAQYQVPYVLMHMHGTPQTMQQHPLQDAVVTEVAQFFKRKVTELTRLGAHQIILDPGFGFGKSLEANYLLLKNLETLRIDQWPLLAGISRKSMINKVLETKPDQALNGTTVLNTIALQNGANLLRVHDVKEAVECIKLVAMYQTVSQ